MCVFVIALWQVRAMKKPPAGVKLTMQATCIMFMIKPVMKVWGSHCCPAQKWFRYLMLYWVVVLLPFSLHS